MKNLELIAVLKRVGVTLGASLISYITLCFLVSLLYAFLWGHKEQMTDIVLTISKYEAQSFMFEFVWKPLKWVIVTIGLVAVSAVLLIVPVIVFTAIYKTGNESINK